MCLSPLLLPMLRHRLLLLLPMLPTTPAVCPSWPPAARPSHECLWPSYVVHWTTVGPAEMVTELDLVGLLVLVVLVRLLDLVLGLAAGRVGLDLVLELVRLVAEGRVVL